MRILHSGHSRRLRLVRAALLTRVLVPGATAGRREDEPADPPASTTDQTPEAHAFFEPWEPAPDHTSSRADPSTGMDDTVFISPGAAPFQCTVADGSVQACTDPEAADRS